MIRLIFEILFFMIEHPEIIVAIGIVDFIGIVLLELESRRYWKNQKEKGVET